MNFARMTTILKKDLRRAPRSGIVFLAIAYPVIITVVVQLVFGSIFDPKPRVGVIDHGQSQFVKDMREGPVDLKEFDVGQEAAMWREVELGNLDLGMIYPEGFDASVVANAPKPLTEKLSTRANMQAMLKLEGLALTTVSKLMPAMPVKVEQVTLTDQVAKSWTERLLPLIVLLSFFVAGTFLTGFAIVDEKMRGTLRAVLTTPTQVVEVIVAKGVFSFGIALLASGLALWLNGALDAMSPVLALTFALAAVMTIELGVMVGFVSKDVNSLYGIVKGMGPLVFIVVMPYLWDGWPAWISKAVPLWYVIHPIVGLVNEGLAFQDVALDLAIAAGSCGLLMVLALTVANRRVQHLDALG